MREKDYREEGRPEDLLQELGYETADIKYKQFSVYAIFFFGFLIVSALAGFVIMWLMVPTKLSGGRMSDSKPKVNLPENMPLLQSNITARTDIMSLRRKETAILDTAGVVDAAKGQYRIPVDQAIEDVVKMSDADKAAMGLPPVAATASGVSTEVRIGGGSSSTPDYVPDIGNVETASTSGSKPIAVSGSQHRVVVNDPAAIAKLHQHTGNPISNSGKKPASNRGESATKTPPTGGKGG